MIEVFADVITIGDEILYGQITDTNSQWISAELDKIGIKIRRKSSVGDKEEEIINILEEAEKRSDIILITGGLGPTNDDITKKTLAKYFGASLVLNNQALQDVSLYFQKRGRELTELNKSQAFLPDCCTCISNTCGTAPGMWFKKGKKIFVSMPGVPYEMKTMMKEDIIPRLQQFFKTPVIYHKIIRTSGIGESFLADKIKDWESNLPSHIKLAYLPSLGEVKLRLTAIGETTKELRTLVDDEVEKVLPLITEYVYGYNDNSLEKVIGELLRQKKLTIATAESCTGGYIAHMLTSVPGSSDYFVGSTVAYSNEIKKQILEVKEETLLKYGAVSEEAVKELAEGVRIKFNADVSISTSGIAGPSGGTEEKPVGTIWIAYSDKNGTKTKKLLLSNQREVNIKLTTTAVFNLIRQNLSKYI